MEELIWKFEHSLECHAGRPFIWSFLTDVSNWERIEGRTVEYIRLEGAFAEGTQGVTKMPDQAPRHWTIAQLDPGHSYTIEMSLGEAIFHNQTILESLAEDRTRITQRMSLTGDYNEELLEGMRLFEENAPEGLAKLVSVVERAFEGKDLPG